MVELDWKVKQTKEHELKLNKNVFPNIVTGYLWRALLGSLMKITSDIKLKLNPLQAKWPIEPALISGFCSFKRIRVFDSPGRDTNPSQVSSQQTLVLIYQPHKDGKLS